MIWTIPGIGYGQNAGNIPEIPFDEFLPQITPPDPVVFEFTKYSGITVNESSGIIAPEIPLFEFKLGDIYFPLSLNYQGNGIKLGQFPGFLGFNWHLNAGGIITREMRDYPDDKAPGQGLHYDYDYYSSLIANPDSDEYTDMVANIITFGNDAEVDIFKCKSFGFTGDFFFDENFVPRLIKNNRSLKIDYYIDQKEIVITDEKGVKYYFGGDGFIRWGGYEEGNASIPQGGSRVFFVQDYYLREVRDVWGNALYFEYDSVSYQGLDGLYEVEKVALYERKEKIPNTACEYQVRDVIVVGPRWDPQYYIFQPSMWMPKLITTSRGDSIRFIPDSQGQLSQIKIYNFQGRLVKQVDLEYYNHAFLTRIRAGDQEYRFEYYDMDGFLAARNTPLAVDVFGYFNGEINNNGLIPGLEAFLPNRYVNREKRFPYALKGAMKRFHYPTGGYDEFEYEEVPLRIKRIKTYTSPSDPHPYIKRYYYTSFDRVNQNSGVRLAQPIPNSFGGTVYRYLLCEDYYSHCSVDRERIDIFLSGMTDPKYTKDFQNYEYVTISLGGDHFEQGGIEKRFIKYNIYPEYAFTSFGYTNHDWNAGTLLHEKFFNNQRNLMKEIYYEYLRDTSKSHVTHNYVWRRKYGLYRCASDEPLRDYYELGHYYTGSYWFNIGRIRTIEHFPSGRITTIEEFDYENGASGLPSKRIVYTENLPSSVDEERYTYVGSPSVVFNCLNPPDHSHQFEPPCVLLRRHQLSSPLVIEKWRNHRLVQTQITRYKEIPTGSIVTPFSTIVVPDSIKIGKGNLPLETKVRFTKYDSFGNPVEIIREDGIPVVYLWGYRHTLPVAKIKGLNYNQLPAGTLNQLESLDWSQVSNDALLNILLGLRNEILALHSEVEVELYVYDPLVGLKIKVDPKGDQTYYEYDSFNRLKFIKDRDGHIRKEYEYHYRED
ncbi:MAG: hypothetical protein GXO27_00450 [Chlorobi bacterium]|nr:hypothetical protein [Chlorobiota bacterium]